LLNIVGHIVLNGQLGVQANESGSEGLLSHLSFLDLDCHFGIFSTVQEFVSVGCDRNTLDDGACLFSGTSHN
jgi:hypothetical protein